MTLLDAGLFYICGGVVLLFLAALIHQLRGGDGGGR